MTQIFKNIANIFSRPKEIPFNVYHPDIEPNIEFAFECKGKKYYRMTQEFRMPTGRYKFLDAYLQEHEMRMDLNMLNAYIDKIEAVLNGKAGIIKLSDIAVTCHNMRTHARLGFMPENIQRLASVVYFDDTEDLRDYDPNYGKKKIQDWLSDGKYAFFLTRPIDELLNIRGISVESLAAYISQQSEIIQELTLDQQMQSSQNSSKDETGK